MPLSVPEGTTWKSTAAGLRVSHTVVVTDTFEFPTPPYLTRSNSRRWR